MNLGSVAFSATVYNFLFLSLTFEIFLSFFNRDHQLMSQKAGLLKLEELHRSLQSSNLGTRKLGKLRYLHIHSLLLI